MPENYDVSAKPMQMPATTSTEQTVKTRRPAPVRPTAQKVTGETAHVAQPHFDAKVAGTPSSNNLVQQQRSITHESIKKDEEAKLQDKKEELPFNNHLKAKDAKIAEIKEKAMLTEVGEAHKAAISRLDAQIAKTTAASRNIFNRLFKNKSEFKTKLAEQNELKSLHETQLKEIDAKLQIANTKSALAPALKEWSVSLDFNPNEAHPLVEGNPTNPSELLVKVGTEYGSNNDKSFATAVKDCYRTTDKMEIHNDQASAAGKGPYIGLNRREDFRGHFHKTDGDIDKKMALPIIFKEELQEIASLTLSPEDQTALKKLLDDTPIRGGEEAEGDVEKMLGPALANAKNNGTFSGPTDRFFRLLNTMRVASRLDIYHAFLKPTVPEGFEFNLSKTIEIAEGYRGSTVIKATDQGFELSQNVHVHMRTNADALHSRVAVTPLSVTYLFDKDMNAIGLRAEPGEPEYFEPKG